MGPRANSVGDVFPSQKRVPPAKSESSAGANLPSGYLEEASPYSLAQRCHLFIDGGWQHREPVSQREGSLPLPWALGLVVAALVKE